MIAVNNLIQTLDLRKMEELRTSWLKQSQYGSVFDYNNSMSETKCIQTKLNLILISVNRRLLRRFQAMTNKKINPNLEIVY